LNRSKELTIIEKVIIQKDVLKKQIELVKLAEQLGTYDKKVLNLQLRLVKSKLFRLWATILVKENFQNVDNVVFDNSESILDLVEYLRDVVYHPKKYKVLSKVGKRSLVIPSIKDQCLKTLINLVLYPLVELTSDPNNYGFRLYRDSKMAIAAVRSQLRTIDQDKNMKGILRRTKHFSEFRKSGLYLKSNEQKFLLNANIQGFFKNHN
jgi:retron-type reverse transcriptase